MKTLFAFLLSLFAFTANAQTVINLQSAPCASGVWCAAVPNDSGGSILLYGNVAYQDVGIILGKPDGSHQGYASVMHANGVIYVGTCPAAPAIGTITLTNVPMGPANISAIFSCTTHTAHSGRGAGSHQVWGLISGSILVP